MLSSVLSLRSLYNLQYRSFIDTPLYTGKGNVSLNWLYTGHTNSTWLSSSVMSSQKGQNRWLSATKKRSLWQFIRETPIRKRANVVLYTLLCTSSRHLSGSKVFSKQLYESKRSILAIWENQPWQQVSQSVLKFSYKHFFVPHAAIHPDITKTIVTQEKLDLRHPVLAITVSFLHVIQHVVCFSGVPIQRLLQESKPV